jgi:hypothetical protein
MSQCLGAQLHERSGLGDTNLVFFAGPRTVSGGCRTREELTKRKRLYVNALGVPSGEAPAA